MTSGRSVRMCRTKSPRISCLPPLLEGFLGAERVAEIHGAGEVLLGAVELVRRQQLFGAQDAERVEQLRPDLVLPAVAARRRHQRHAHARAAARTSASIALFSSSGCAVACISVPTVLSFLSASDRPGAPERSESGGTRYCGARCWAEPAAVAR